MHKKNSSEKKSTSKSIAHRVVSATKKVKARARAMLMTPRETPRSLPVLSRGHDSPVARALRKEHKRIEEELRKQEVLAQDHPTTGNHMADDATEVAEQAKALALRRHLERMLNEVERAMMRAEKGMYGVCEVCGNKIAPERLQVVPSAALCIEHARTQYVRAKMAA